MAYRSLARHNRSEAARWASRHGDTAALTAELCDLAGAAARALLVIPAPRPQAGGSGPDDREHLWAKVTIAARTAEWDRDILDLIGALGPEGALEAVWDVACGLLIELAAECDITRAEAVELALALHADDSGARGADSADEDSTVHTAWLEDAVGILESRPMLDALALTEPAGVVEVLEGLPGSPHTCALTLAFGAVADARSDGAGPEEASTYLPGSGGADPGRPERH